MATSDPSSFQESAADVLAIVVLVIVPVIGIVVFWLVHIIPEKVAENRHHPQKEAIKVLCLLSLVFGGLLWPIAWLWAYSKPVLHKLAYGEDKHEDFYLEHGPVVESDAEPERAALPLHEVAVMRNEIENLRLQVEALAGRGVSSSDLKPLTQRLEAMRRVVDERTPREARH